MTGQDRWVDRCDSASEPELACLAGEDHPGVDDLPGVVFRSVVADFHRW